MANYRTYCYCDHCKNLKPEKRYWSSTTITNHRNEYLFDGKKFDEWKSTEGKI